MQHRNFHKHSPRDNSKENINKMRVRCYGEKVEHVIFAKKINEKSVFY